MMHPYVCRIGEGVCLQQALSQALLCPLRGHNYFPLTLQNTVWDIPLKGEGWRPIWQAEAGDPTPAMQYTTRKRGDQKFIVRLPDALYTVHRCGVLLSLLTLSHLTLAVMLSPVCASASLRHRHK